MARPGLTSTSGPSALPELVVIGCSRGGLAALTDVLSGLPADFPAAVLVVQHLAAGVESRLAAILNERTPLSVEPAKQGRKISAGVVYTAPPDRHLTVNRYGRIRLDDRAKVNFSRPSVDRLFQSAAQHFREHVTAVLLSGFGKDGAAGVIAVHGAGGRVIVESDVSAQDFGMPGAALATGVAAKVLPASEIPNYLQQVIV